MELSFFPSFYFATQGVLLKISLSAFIRKWNYDSRSSLKFVFILGGLMGPVRMISSGHELTTDYDEKTLHELGFKDMQVLPAYT